MWIPSDCQTGDFQSIPCNCELSKKTKTEKKWDPWLMRESPKVRHILWNLLEAWLLVPVDHHLRECEKASERLWTRETPTSKAKTHQSQKRWWNATREHHGSHSSVATERCWSNLPNSKYWADYHISAWLIRSAFAHHSLLRPHQQELHTYNIYIYILLLLFYYFKHHYYNFYYC